MGRTVSGGDAYDAFGYLLDVNSGSTITILDKTGATSSASASGRATVTIGILAKVENTALYLLLDLLM
ncbi:MAG: hypothetical protein U5K53_08610 [Halanaerobiales bacterium]|nr:hypothetical protein [Halanaerobiales bacterium]